MYKKPDFTKKFCDELITEYGNMRKAARAVHEQCVDPNGGVPSEDAVRIWIQDGHRLKTLTDPDNKEKINRIAELLERANIPIDAIGKIENVKLKAWGVHAKDPETGKIVTEGLHGTTITLSPTWGDGPAWPLIQPAAPVSIKYTPPTIIVPRGLRTEVVHPDTQIGYQRVLDSRSVADNVESYEMLPIHDEQAMDVACQITAAIQPDGFTHVGDIMDFSEFSKYLQVEQFFRTTQGAIDYAYSYLARISAQIGPGRKIRGKRTKKKLRLVDGNHDWKRLATYVQMNARAAFGLRPAMKTPETWPDLTVPHLLRTDELGFEHCGMWPGSEAWLIEGQNALVVVHDPRKKGDYQASVISGHSHHRKEEAFTVRTPFGFQEFTHHQIGCLCSLERIKDKASIQRMRVPSDRGFAKDWVHGIAVIEILEDTGQHQVNFIRIQNGTAIYQGERFRADAKSAASKSA